MGTVTQLSEASRPATFTSPWLTQKEAAAFSRRSVRTVNEALRAGTLCGYQTKERGNWTVNVEDLNTWIRNGSPTAAISRR